jgi:hypothetical protein
VGLHAQARRRRGHEGEHDEGVERLVAAGPEPAVLGRRVVGDEGGVEAGLLGRVRHLRDRLGAHELVALRDVVGQ